MDHAGWTRTDVGRFTGGGAVTPHRRRSSTRRVASRFAALASVVTVLATLTISAPAQAAPAPAPNQRDVAAWNTFANAGGHFTQGDATYTTKLLDGRIVWLFADSFLGTTTYHPTPAPGYWSRGSSPMLKNQVLVEDPSTTPPTFHQVWPGGVTGATTWTGAGCAAEWPLASIQTTLNTFQTLLRCVDANMKVLRIDVATTTFNSGYTGWTTSISFLGSAFFSGVTCGTGPNGNVEFGSSILQTWGGPTYIYGLQRCSGFTHMMVARVPGNDLTATWSYWSADGLGNVGWHGYYAGIPEPINDTAGGDVIHAGDEYSVVSTGSGLRMLTSDVGVGPLMKYTAAAGAYTGPFTRSPNGVYFTPPENGQVARQTGTPDPNCKLTTYGAKEHPALETGGNMIFSYNVNVTSVPSTCPGKALPADLKNYRARFYTGP
jgi:hypothetical protein